MGRTWVFYVLEVEASECRVDAYLNDVCVIRRGTGTGAEYGGQVNHLLVPGRNEVTLVIEPGEEPSRALTGDAAPRPRAPSPPARATARLARYPRGATVGSDRGEPLIDLAWDADEGAELPWPQVRAASADLGPSFGPPPWAAAAPLTLDAATRRAAHVTLSELRDHLAAHRWDAFLELTRPRLAWVERAYQLSPGEKADHARRVLAAEGSAPHAGVEPLEPAAYDLRLAGNGRLLECVAKDGLAILRGRPDHRGDRATYDAFLARVEEGWRVVL